MSKLWYVAVCQDCEPVLPTPFTNPRERAAWVVAHRKTTGHTVTVKDEPRNAIRRNPSFVARLFEVNKEFNGMVMTESVATSLIGQTTVLRSQRDGEAEELRPVKVLQAWVSDGWIVAEMEVVE